MDNNSDRRPSLTSLLVTALVVALGILVALIVSNDFKFSSVIEGRFKQHDPNIKSVILITVDTLRADVLSSYGSGTSVSTPHIDQLASDGILFSKAISPSSWTLPSVASIMTGLSPNVHRTTERSSRLPDNLKTLAEYMHDSGFRTYAVGYNPFLLPKFNLSQGFSEYNFFPKVSTVDSRRVHLLPSTAELTEMATGWLESNRGEDFFLWIHYLDPHVPYAPPTEFLPDGKPPPDVSTHLSDTETAKIRNKKFIPSPSEKQWIRDLYNGEVRYVDRNIGKLIDKLKVLNLYERSLIVFTSDHGEEFWEHGGFEHGHTLYDEVLWVPLIVKPPGSDFKGVTVEAKVSTINIMPTVLSLYHIDHGRSYLTSDSLSAFWKSGEDDIREEPIISTGLLYGRDRESVIFEGLKYIRSVSGGHEELFDLTSDPEEQYSILESSPDKAEEAKNILVHHHRRASKLREELRLLVDEKVDLDDETKKQLESLGYVQ